MFTDADTVVIVTVAVAVWTTTPFGVARFSVSCSVGGGSVAGGCSSGGGASGDGALSG